MAHALLGIALALLVWAAGDGWARRLRPAALPYAYAIGLLVVAAAAWLILVSGWLLPVAFALIAPAVFARLRLAALLRSSPFALALGITLGALLHGPTASEDSHAYGDMLFYAAKLASAAESVLPIRDLLVEGETSTYVEAGSTFLGSALPGIDPILFQAATMPAYLVAALALGLGTLGLRPAGWQVAALAPLAIAVVAYPTWISESPPVAMAVPLAIPLYALARDHGWFAPAAVVLGLSFALTKGFGVLALAVAVGFAANATRRRIGTRRTALAALPVALVAAAAVGFFVATSSWLADILDFRFLPATALDGALDQLDRRDTQAAAPAFVVGGELLLAVALALARAWLPLSFLGAAIGGSWIIGGHGFDIVVGLAIVIAIVHFAGNPAALRATLPLVVAAGSALGLSAFFRDVFGVRAGIVLGLVLGAGAVAAIAPVRAYAGLVAIAAVAIVGAAVGGLTDAQTTLGPDDYDIWRAVERRVPSTGLVFTSETGPALGDSTEGWNYYPGVARRQVYLAGWSSSPLLVDEGERARRLALNAAVLSGEDPRRLELDRDYSGFYAVIVDTPPAGWRRLHANDTFGLYEIP